MITTLQLRYILTGIMELNSSPVKVRSTGTGVWRQKKWFCFFLLAGHIEYDQLLTATANKKVAYTESSSQVFKL